MKMWLKKMWAGARVALCTTVIAVTAASENMPAQIQGAALLDEGTRAGQSLVQSLVRFLQIGLGIAALVTLVVAIYNLFKQEREAATKLIWWFVGLAVGFAVLLALGNQLAGI